MIEATVIMKSGAQFTITALEVETTSNAHTGLLEQIRWVGASGNIPLHIAPGEVAAVYYNKLPEESQNDT